MARAKGMTGVGIGLGAAALAVVLAAGEAPKAPSATQPAAATNPAGPTLHAVKKGRLQLDISGEGTLQPVDAFEVKLKMKAYAGGLTVAKAAAPGAAVKKGDLLLEIEPTEFNWQLTAAQTAAAAARANLAKAESDAQLGEKGDALALRIQQEGLKHAEEAVTWWEKVDGPQMLLNAELNLKQVKDNQGDQEDELDQLRKMYKSEELTSATADIVVKRAVRRLELTKQYATMAEERTDKSKKVDYPIARQRVLDGLEQARQQLAALKATQEQSKVLRAGALATARTAAEQAEARLKDILADQALLTIKAPADGVVIYTQAGEQGELKGLKAGDKLAAGAVPMKLVTPGKMKVEISLGEQQAFWAEAGMKAKVTPAALPAVSYEGTCAAPVAIPRTQPPGLGFTLTINLPETDPRLLPGMKASVKVEAGKGDESLVIPLSAVSGGSVTVKGAKGEETRAVVLGRCDGQQVEVKSGLKEGEEIVLGGKR